MSSPSHWGVPSAAVTVALAIAVGIGLSESAAVGQTSSEPPTPASLSVTGSLPSKVPLSAGVERDLREIQDQWVQWMRAFFRNQPEPSDSLVDSLLRNVRQLGLERLPDLSIGASARVVESVTRRAGTEDAPWALAAAERLDPGRPETAFAWAVVRRQEGRSLAALWNELDGYRRLFAAAPGRHLAIASLVLGFVLALVLAAGLFVALQMGVKGPLLLADLETMIGHGIGLPPPILRILAMLLLLWPLLLPTGILWLLLYWSALLFVYGSLSDRVAIGLCWVLVVIAPVAISWQRQQVDLALTPAMRGLEALVEGRLYGQLFQDLEHLSSLLPDDPAVIQVMADLHRGLGQWDTALELYRRVLEVEPENAWARIDLGSYYFFKGDFGSARDEFRQAAESAETRGLKPQAVIGYYNLSQAYVYSDSPLFDDAQRELQRAQRIDAGMVSRLQRETGDQRVVSIDGGLRRAGEIRQRLFERLQTLAAAERDSGEGQPSGTERAEEAPRPTGARLTAHLPGVLGAVLVTLLYFMIRPRDSVPPPRGASGTLREALVPGLASVRAGRGGRALCAIVTPVFFLMLPLTDKLTYSFFPLYGATGIALWFLAVGGLILFIGGRLVLARLG